jgi:hypothetical protein
MPAALRGAARCSALAGDAIQKRNMAGDTIASLAYVANWRFIFSNQAYADLFGGESPVLHFWSLAIEEQFYLLFPVLAWVVLQYYRKSRQWFGGILAALVVVSFACTMLLGLSRDAIYYGTETRASELLLGGVLAVVVYHRRVTTRLAHDSGCATRSPPSAFDLALLVCAGLWWCSTCARRSCTRVGSRGVRCCRPVIVACIIDRRAGCCSRVTPAPARPRLLRRLPVPLAPVPLAERGAPVSACTPCSRSGWPSRFAVARCLPVPRDARAPRALLNLPPGRLAPPPRPAITVAVIAITVSAPKPGHRLRLRRGRAAGHRRRRPPPPTDPARNEPRSAHRGVRRLDGAR